MKLTIGLAGSVALMLIFTPANQADVVNFPVSATVPAATGVSITATKVNADTNQWGEKVTQLNFDPLGYKSTLGIWLPGHYFAIDVGTSGGAGSTNVNVKYTEALTDKPTGQTKGLGYKTVATFIKVVNDGSDSDTLPDEIPLTNHGPKKLLFQISGSGESITSSELSGGFFRTYIGVYSGDNATLNTAGGEPFTNSDKPGNYKGTLTITATVA